MKKIWNMVRRISGKPATTSTSHLKVNGTTIEQPTEIANVIASTVAHNSSSDHYTERFRRFKAHQEKRNVTFASNNLEEYNLPFSLSELQKAIHKAHDSATGPDNIHYQMLKHLPATALNTLYCVFSMTYGQQVNSHKAGLMPLSSPSQSQEKTPLFLATIDPLL